MHVRMDGCKHVSNTPSAKFGEGVKIGASRDDAPKKEASIDVLNTT